MPRLTEEQKKEYDKLMADPATAAKARTVLFGLMDELEEADRAKREAEAKDKPKGILDDIFPG